MANLTLSEISHEGLELPAGVAATALGDEFENTGRQCLLITNSGEGTPTVTVPAQRTCSQGVDHNVEVELEAGNVTPYSVLVGPFAPWWYNDEDGKCHVAYSAHADVTVAVLYLPRTSGPVS